ncbi:uncharacterized protein ACO6RY_01604 [Pungitius sinensis]
MCSWFSSPDGRTDPSDNVSHPAGDSLVDTRCRGQAVTPGGPVGGGGSVLGASLLPCSAGGGQQGGRALTGGESARPRRPRTGHFQLKTASVIRHRPAEGGVTSGLKFSLTVPMRRDL